VITDVLKVSRFASKQNGLFGATGLYEDHATTVNGKGTVGVNSRMRFRATGQTIYHLETIQIGHYF
jgi:hypothetical protein